MKKPQKEYSAAIVTIKRPDEMNKSGVKQIAQWLRRQADFLENHNKEMASRFCARYIYK